MAVLSQAFDQHRLVNPTKHTCMRRVCVDLLDAAWGVGMCRIVVSVTRVYRVGVLFGLVRFALLLADVLCWVDRCFDSWVLLGLLCLLRVTYACDHAAYTCTAIIDT